MTQITKFKATLKACETDKGKCSEIKRALNQATRDQEKLKTPLTGTAEILDEVGESITEFENKKTLFKFIKTSIKILNQPKEGGFCTRGLLRLSVPKIQSIFQAKVSYLSENTRLQSSESNNDLEKLRQKSLR